MSIPNEEFLELEKYSNNFIHGVKLGNGWEVTDLSSNLSLWVTLVTGQNCEIDFISTKFLKFHFKEYGYYHARSIIAIDEITIRNVVDVLSKMSDSEIQELADYWQKYRQ